MFFEILQKNKNKKTLQYDVAGKMEKYSGNGDLPCQQLTSASISGYKLYMGYLNWMADTCLARLPLTAPLLFPNFSSYLRKIFVPGF